MLVNTFQTNQNKTRWCSLEAQRVRLTSLRLSFNEKKVDRSKNDTVHMCYRSVNTSSSVLQIETNLLDFCG